MWQLKIEIMKRCILILINTLAFVNIIFSQSNINPVGIYVCTSDVISYFDYVDKNPNAFHKYFYNIGLEVLRINEDSITIWPLTDAPVYAKLKGDSLFFEYNNSNENLKGKGKFTKDSIYLSYSAFSLGNFPEYITKSGYKLSLELKTINSNSIKCYPNPVIDNFMIEAEIPILVKQANLEIVSVDGKYLWTNQLTERGFVSKQLTVPAMQSGIYIVRLRFDSTIVAYIRICKM